MKDEDYELLPHEELERLRKEVDVLKKNPYADSKQNKTLLESMESLTTSIKKLTAILEDAQEDLIKEYAEASPSKLLKQISMQNAKIAEGIVALSEMLKQGDSGRQAAPQSQSQRFVAPQARPQPRPMPTPPRFPSTDEFESENKKSRLGDF